MLLNTGFVSGVIFRFTTKLGTTIEHPCICMLHGPPLIMPATIELGANCSRELRSSLGSQECRPTCFVHLQDLPKVGAEMSKGAQAIDE